MNLIVLLVLQTTMLYSEIPAKDAEDCEAKKQYILEQYTKAQAREASDNRVYKLPRDYRYEEGLYLQCR